jgi:hypothetical protein
LQNSINNNKLYTKIGQVSLPVLSRKGKNDHWNYNWISKKNYSLLFNEDLFIKNFFFIFFMYTISKNKHFISIFFKKKLYFNNKLNVAPYNLTELKDSIIFKYINNQNTPNCYVSNIYICRYINWIFIYLYIHNAYNLRNKTLKNKNKNHCNLSLFNQIYEFSKNKYKNSI